MREEGITLDMCGGDLEAWAGEIEPLLSVKHFMEVQKVRGKPRLQQVREESVGEGVPEVLVATNRALPAQCGETWRTCRWICRKEAP